MWTVKLTEDQIRKIWHDNIHVPLSNLSPTMFFNTNYYKWLSWNKFIEDVNSGHVTLMGFKLKIKSFEKSKESA